MNVTFIFDQGADETRILTWLDPSGVPVDLSGCYAAFQVRLGGPDAALGLDMDSGAKGGIVLGGDTGTVTITVPHADSTALDLSAVPTGMGEETQADGTIRRACGALCAMGLEIHMGTLPEATVVRLISGNVCFTREVVRDV